MATRTLGERHFVLVEVDDGDGVGFGYTYAGTAGARLVADAVRDILAPLLLGACAEEIADLWQRMYHESLLVGRRGALLRAISAVDIALWDLHAKRRGVPLAVLLGGTTARPVPAYASGGYYRPDDGPPAQAVIAEIKGNQESGFVDHKIKVGGLSVPEDSRRVAAAAEVIGTSGRLAVDANNAYQSVSEALRAARAFERAAGETGLWWFEEPLSPENVVGHAQLSATLETPIAIGELHQTRWEFAALIRERAAGVLQPDVGVLGGISEFLRVAHTAESFDLPVAPHWHANLHAHLAAASPGTVVIEYFDLDKDIYNLEKLVVEEARLRVADGHVLLNNEPGIGLTFDEAAVGRYEISR